MRRFMRRRSSIAFLMCMPLLIVVSAPGRLSRAIYAIYLSMLNKRMTKFVGLGNFSSC